MTGQAKATADKQTVPIGQQRPKPPPIPPRPSDLEIKARPESAMTAEDADKTESLPDEDVFNPADPLFVVMGVTGAGKSTFISLLSEDDVEVGHGLQSSKAFSISILPTVC